MTWSLRARLTAWYTAIVVAVLGAGAVAATIAHHRLGLQRLDEELARLMLTLEGVMRTEINEGLTLAAAADEASLEVVAPDRSLLLARPEAAVLASWGKPLPRAWPPSELAPGFQTLESNGRAVRLFRRDIDYKGHSYIAAVGAALDDLDEQRLELVESIAVGVGVGFAVAGLGGWWVGRRTLQPLADMATQAESIAGHAPTPHLRAPRRDDELGRLAGAFNGLLDRLAATSNAQRQFMADASHELRTPVSIVRTTAQVALTRERSADDYREALAIVAEQTARVTRLVDGMFLLARAEANGIAIARELLYLDDLLAECARGLQVLAHARGVTIRLEVSNEVSFSGDAVLLRQMISNLLDNAVRHAKAGGEVRVSLRHEPPNITIAVRDDGPGVAAEDREQIFERFVRRDVRSQGAGLGLPIARWVAEAHGGRLVLAPERGPGAEFVVTLPG
jgi:signal transduction histidine kinase